MSWTMSRTGAQCAKKLSKFSVKLIFDQHSKYYVPNTGKQMSSQFDTQRQFISPMTLSVLEPTFHRHAFSRSVLGTTTVEGNPCVKADETPFVGHDQRFSEIVGANARVTVLATKDYPFAHEAGVYVPEEDEVWITSNLLEATGGSATSTGKRVEISRLSLARGSVDIVDLPAIRLGNGGCPYDGGILFCDQGGGSGQPSQLVHVDPNTLSSRVLLNNYNGRRFNSLNDVIVLPPRGTATSSTRPSPGTTIWFTDPPYGFEQGFRPPCQLPPQIYVFDPESGEVKAVADGFDHPNGIAFSPDGETCYITDTSHINGTGHLDPSLQSSM
jgi:gluconolactonase